MLSSISTKGFNKKPKKAWDVKSPSKVVNAESVENYFTGWISTEMGVKWVQYLFDKRKRKLNSQKC